MGAQMAAPPPPPGPPVSAPSYYPPYSYPYYGYPYVYPSPTRPLEPRHLRTVQAFDLSVFMNYLLGASFVWSALVAAVAIAALVPRLAGSGAGIGLTERGWLDGVMVARVVVWLIFALSAILALSAFLKFHEGRSEFGEAHERNYRDLQASIALFGAVAGGAGLLSLIVANGPVPGPGSQDPVDQLISLRASMQLSAAVWGAAVAFSGALIARALVQMLRPFVTERTSMRLKLVPVLFAFVPLLHAALSIAFLGLADVETNTWDAASLRAVGETGGLAGLAAAVPITLLLRALREAQDRVLSGAVKPESAKKTA